MAKLKIIYEPKGEAGEYSPLALNLRVGCEHKCRYCYGWRALRLNKIDFHEHVRTKENGLENLEHDAAMLRGDDRQILLSFATDPYSIEDLRTGLTRQAIEILIKNALRFTVLTKGGTRACRDFDLLENYDKCMFGTSLVFTSQRDADHWEPNAALVADRIKAIKIAHEKGIRTWLNLEPVIDPAQAITLVKNLHPIVNWWTVGMLNYDKEVSDKIDWPRFRNDITGLFDSVGADCYIKRNLRNLQNASGKHKGAALPEKKAVYLSGPCFTEAERAWLTALKKQIEERGGSSGENTVVISPWELSTPGEVESLGCAAAEEIFRRCREALDQCDTVVAVLDGPMVNDGTAWEVGYAYAIRKRTIGIRTDLRRAGEYEGSSTNLMIERGCERVVKSSEKLLKLLFS